MYITTHLTLCTHVDMVIPDLGYLIKDVIFNLKKINLDPIGLNKSLNNLFWIFDVHVTISGPTTSKPPFYPLFPQNLLIRSMVLYQLMYKPFWLPKIPPSHMFINKQTDRPVKRRTSQVYSHSIACMHIMHTEMCTTFIA